MLPNKKFLLNVPFQSTKYKKKELCVDNVKTIGDVYSPTCRNEKYVYISTNKTTSFYDCKKCKACCHVLKIPFKDQKPTIMLFGGDGTHCLRESRLRKRKTTSFFEEFSPPITVTHTKKGKYESKYGINLFASFWFIIWATYSIFKSFYSISIFSQPV